MVQPPIYGKTGYNRFKPVFLWSYNIFQIQKTTTKTAKDQSTYTQHGSSLLQSSSVWSRSSFRSYGLDLETLAALQTSTGEQDTHIHQESSHPSDETDDHSNRRKRTISDSGPGAGGGTLPAQKKSRLDENENPFMNSTRADGVATQLPANVPNKQFVITMLVNKYLPLP
jgi:hypothetical protein